MTEFWIDGSDMVKWTRYLDAMPKKTSPMLARGLNTFGNTAVRAWSRELADETGLEAGAVLNLIVVREATPNNLEYSADASAVVTANAQWLRPWAERDQSTFEQDTLVKIVTVGDHADCEVCVEAAANSPYTLREVKEMAEKWANFHAATGPAPGERTNLVHPNCRCTYQPWTSTRRLPLSFGGKGAMPPELMSARQLGQHVAGELQLVLKVKS